MLRVLASGVPAEACAWLGQRLPDVEVRRAAGAEEALDQLGREVWVALVLGPALSPADSGRILAEVRARPELAHLEVLPFDDGDRDALARRAEEACRHYRERYGGAPLTPEQMAILARVWEESKEQHLEQATRVEQACAARESGTLAPGDLREALRTVHQLAGALGTFGRREESALAREIEEALRTGQAGGLAERARDLRLRLVGPEPA